MLHHRSRAAGLIALLALLVLAPGAGAADSKTSPGGATAKERAYGKHCGPKGKGRASQRAKCLDAMARLATGRASSPQAACRGLSRKKAKGERKSAHARCVSEGRKLLKSKRGRNGGTASDDDGAWGDDPEAAGDDGDDGDDGASGADDPDDVDPDADAGADTAAAAADDDDPAADDGRAQG